MFDNVIAKNERRGIYKMLYFESQKKCFHSKVLFDKRKISYPSMSGWLICPHPPFPFPQTTGQGMFNVSFSIYQIIICSVRKNLFFWMKIPLLVFKILRFSFKKLSKSILAQLMSSLKYCVPYSSWHKARAMVNMSSIVFS